MLLTDYLYENPFPAPTVKLAVENTLPGTEMKLPISYRYDYFPAHDLSFEVGISIVFVPIVTVLGNRFMRGKLFKPYLVIKVQSGLN